MSTKITNPEGISPGMLAVVEAVSHADIIEDYALSLQRRAYQLISQTYGQLPAPQREFLRGSEQHRKNLRDKFLAQLLAVRKEQMTTDTQSLDIKVRLTIAMQAFSVAWFSALAPPIEVKSFPLFPNDLAPPPDYHEVQFTGSSQDNPIGFIINHYGPWIKAGLMSMAHIVASNPRNKKIEQHIFNQLRENRRQNQKNTKSNQKQGTSFVTDLPETVEDLGLVEPGQARLMRQLYEQWVAFHGEAK